MGKFLYAPIKLNSIKVIDNFSISFKNKGNKGAISIRFTLYGSSVCVVNAHLAAHDHMLDQRCEDYDKIVEEHKFHVKGHKEIFKHE